MWTPRHCRNNFCNTTPAGQDGFLEFNGSQPGRLPRFVVRAIGHIARDQRPSRHSFAGRFHRSKFAANLSRVEMSARTAQGAQRRLLQERIGESIVSHSTSSQHTDYRHGNLRFHLSLR